MRVLLVEFLPHVLGSGGSEEEKCKYLLFFSYFFLIAFQLPSPLPHTNMGTFESRVNRNFLKRALP